MSLYSRKDQCVFQIIYEKMPCETWNDRNIGAFRYFLGQKLAGQVKNKVKGKVDAVVPVPASGKYYAMGVAEQLSVPYVEALFKKENAKRSFHEIDREKREDMIHGAIHPIGELLKGKRIALVDEGIFTGITLKAVCGSLAEYEVSDIYICIPTPMVERCCPYKLQPKRQLITQSKDAGELTDYFHAKGVYFQEYECFQHLFQNWDEICMECYKKQTWNTIDGRNTETNYE
jgi:amidophosphoribosyltransferase